MNDKQLQKMESILKMLDNQASFDELVKIVASVVATFKAMRDEIDKNQQFLDSLAGRLDKAVSKRLSELKDGHTPSKQELMSLITPLIPDVKDGKDADETKIVADVLAKVPKQEKVTGDGVIDAINSRETTRDIRKERVEGLSDLISLVQKLETSLTHVNSRVVGSSGRNLVKALNLNDYGPLDGVTKTFNIPAVYRIISVHASSFPGAFVENIDFTWTPTSITFTDEIDASATLAAGQTVTILYVEA